MGNISFPVAFIAGILSFISPCVLPLVPAYLIQLVGPSVAQSIHHNSLRWRLRTFLHALFFVAGFTLAFVALGATASVLGNFIKSHQIALRQIGGLLLIILGLHLTGLLKLPFLYREHRFQFRSRQPSYPASFIVGLVFALGWTPCVGVVLAPILALAANAGTLSQGVLLLLVYSAGLGIPFLAMGAAANVISPWLKKLSPYTGIVEVATGVCIIAFGFIIFFNYFIYFNQFFNFLPTLS